MAKQHKSKKQTQAPQPTQSAQTKQQQSTTRKVFTVIICVVVALGLMLPVTGLGVASCAASPGIQSDIQSQQEQQGQQGQQGN